MTRSILTALFLTAAPALAHAQDAAAERMRALENSLTQQQQIQPRLEALEQRQTNLELQRQSDAIARDSAAQAARAAAAPSIPPLTTYYSPSIRTAEPVFSPAQKAEAKAEKQKRNKAKAKKKA